MKKFFLFLFSLSATFTFAQSDDQHCATDIVMKRLYAADPSLQARKSAHDAMLRNAPEQTASATYRIPVVVHILHLGGPENISDYQVRDAIRILNEDYAKQNPDIASVIPSMQGRADSTGIQFVLATKDPNGNCTNGINHYYDTDTDWDDQSPSLYSYSWDASRYLNVYIVRSITLTGGFSAAGYTYFPGTFNPGDARDAIVVLNNYFGSIGTGTAFQSRVLTHEVGHWFDLYHVFGGTNSAGVDCSGDDYVNDTPTTPGYLICPDPQVPSSYQLCTPGVDENFQNFMDYSYCCHMFTHDQGVRMRAALQSPAGGRNNLWTNSNLTVTGVINPMATCVPIADFKYDREITCVGAPVTFYDASWNAHPSGYAWLFPGGTPSSSTDSMEVVTYNAPGIYSATLTTSSSAGTSAPVTKTNIITVTNNTAQYQTYWSESFETNPLPNNDWQIANSSGGANWVQSFDAAFTGVSCAELPSTGNTRNAVTTMISPSVNLSVIATPMLEFQVAAAESNPNHINTLQVYASTDCRETWSLIYSKTGNNLITSPTNVSPFIPADPSEWRLETISLAPFSSATYASFKFVYIRDTLPSPNNIFIDDINVYGSNGIVNAENTFSMSVFPNPSSGTATVSIALDASHAVKAELTDMLGRVVESKEAVAAGAGNYSFQFGEGEKLNAGVYFVTVFVEGKRMTQKLVVE